MLMPYDYLTDHLIPLCRSTGERIIIRRSWLVAMVYVRWNSNDFLRRSYEQSNG